MDSAGALLREPAAEMSVVEPNLVAQHVKERRLRRDLDGSRLPVQLKGDPLCHFEPLVDTRCCDTSDEVNTGMPPIHEPARGPCALAMVGLDEMEWPLWAPSSPTPGTEGSNPAPSSGESAANLS